MKPKIKYKDYDKSIAIMQKNISQFTDGLWIPPNKIRMNNIDTHSWFSISESSENKKCNFIEHKYNTENLDIPSYKCKKITLILNKLQKDILNNWLNTYALMYNCSIRYIKNNIDNNKNVLKFMNLRQLLKDEKKQLLEKSNIKVHDIDGAIKMACTMYKSAITNRNNGNITNFRIRYWKKKKEIKIMDLEKQNFTVKGIRAKILGNIKGFYNGQPFNFGDIKCDCKLQKINGNYYLFVPEKIEAEEKNKPNKMISPNPGIRTFFTGITENKVVKIGDNKCIIKEYLKRKDKIMGNKKIPDEIKKKNEKMINRKISNIVNVFHWKTIKYLTDNNAVILLGNMSTKNISKKEGNLDKMSKRIALMLRLYQFKQRIRFKCGIKGIGFEEVDEWNTSKMCSKCGNIKDDLGGKKVYECIKCKTKMDRDINGSRNIYFVAIKK